MNVEIYIGDSIIVLLYFILLYFILLFECSRNQHGGFLNV